MQCKMWCSGSPLIVYIMRELNLGGEGLECARAEIYRVVIRSSGTSPGGTLELAILRRFLLTTSKA